MKNPWIYKKKLKESMKEIDEGRENIIFRWKKISKIREKVRGRDSYRKKDSNWEGEIEKERG